MVVTVTMAMMAMVMVATVTVAMTRMYSVILALIRWPCDIMAMVLSMRYCRIQRVHIPGPDIRFLRPVIGFAPPFAFQMKCGCRQLLYQAAGTAFRAICQRRSTQLLQRVKRVSTCFAAIRKYRHFFF
jgi:hypothetical protein